MQPCHSMKDEGYHDSCSVSAVSAVTGVPFKEVAEYMMRDFGVTATDGGFPIRIIRDAVEHFGFHADSERCGYMEYMLGLSGWPKKLTEVVAAVGPGKAVVDIVMVPGDPETGHALAVENGMVADIVVSETPVPVAEWLRLYHEHPSTNKVWGDPDVIGHTILTQNPIPKEGV